MSKGSSPTRKSQSRPSAKTRSAGGRSFERQAQARQRTQQRKATARRTRSPHRSVNFRGTLKKLPRGALICFLVAFLNAVSWSIITPPFQAPDELSHFAYVQEIALNERLPVVGPTILSEAESTVLGDLHSLEVRWRPERHQVSSVAEQRHLETDLSRNLSSRATGLVGVAASQPPLYYAAEMGPFILGRAGSLLDQLELMRLFSALMGGITAFFIFLFVRETLPSTPWSWTAGGLSVALAPALGVSAGAVNPDSLLFAVSAAIFYMLARAFRRGFTRRLSVEIGCLTAVGFLTKLNFVGLAPGLLLGLVVLAIRTSRTEGRTSALRSLATAIGIGMGPVVVYLGINLLSNHAGFGLVSSAIDSMTRRGSLLHELSYIWQFYLPHLPGMTRFFPGFDMTRVWFDRSVGLYGSLDTSFQPWANSLALLPTALIALLCLSGVFAGRSALRSRAGEIVVYAAMGLGVMTMVGATSYLSLGSEASGYMEPRYLLPALPLLGALLGLASRGAGRRLAPLVAISIVMLFFAHDIFSQLLVVSRYYS